MKQRRWSDGADIGGAITLSSQSSCSDQIPFHLCVSLRESGARLKAASTKEGEDFIAEISGTYDFKSYLNVYMTSTNDKRICV